MAGKSLGQKYKSLLVWQILLKQTDKNHSLTAKRIKKILSDDYGVEAEEHSIRRDIKELQRLYDADDEILADEGERLPYKIEYDGKGERGYKISKRPCKFSDLQLLVECVHSARFISAEQEQRLMLALTEFCSEFEYEELKSESQCVDRVKTKNSEIIDSVKEINKAIREKKKIRFKYTRYTFQNRQEQTYRRKGVAYMLSPFKILINGGNFYLLAFDGNKMVTYRLDRMKGVKKISEAREGAEEYSKLDMRTYTKRVFGMYSGQEKKVSIRFTNDMLDTVIDRFGADDVFYTPTDERHFTIHANISVSDQFFSWICSFRKKAVITSPQEVIDDFQQFISDIQERY